LYPKRLIEVDLPIKRISAHARREKSIRHGHISTLHIWWARRPLAACRAVICASLWPDPADPLCPQDFRDKAARLITDFAKKAGRNNELAKSCTPETWAKWLSLAKPENRLDPTNEPHLNILRFALLDFIADFANWDNSTVSEYLETSRALTQAAHESLGGAPGTRPLVVDPFAGGGSIPLEALRVGADAFASDLNPVPVLLNKVVLEYIPKYGQSLADEVRKWGAWIKREAEKEIGQYYPKGPDGATPIAYLWARIIQCEGPTCGAEVPLIRTIWLAKRTDRSVALLLLPNLTAKRVDFRIIVKEGNGWVDQSDPKAKVAISTFDGTVKRGSATCPCCGYTTPVARVREQLKTRLGGTDDARLLCVVTTQGGEQGRVYRLPNDKDMKAVRKATAALEESTRGHNGRLSLVPAEKISLNEIRRISIPLYGMAAWGDMFSRRQLLVLTTVARIVRELSTKAPSDDSAIPPIVVGTLLSLVMDRLADSLSSSVTWTPGGEFQGHTFTRQALAFVSDFAEVNPWCDSSGNWMGAVEWVSKVCESNCGLPPAGHVERASATKHPLPNESADAIMTDPPYYDAVPYAHLSDFFYVWLRRSIGEYYPDLFSDPQVAKDEEIVVDRPHELSNSTHDIEFYESELTKAFAESCRIVRPDGIATIVFASKTTASWEAMLKAVVDAGWIITGSWPIDTEREARMAAQGQARLTSSVHLICRPRKNPRGVSQKDDVGDWRDVLQALPRRIHEWMPRLADEGVVGADAIFACLGPALEVFSRYRRVEKASGEVVTLKEYLEQVWAAVSKEAITMVFKGGDASGFEEDARLTAMWLWTLSAGVNGDGQTPTEDIDDEDSNPIAIAPKGYVLEYDAARKIAQGLGAHLDSLTSLVEVKGETARLLPVAERTRKLFGKDEAESPSSNRKKKSPQLELGFVAELKEAEEAGTWGAKGAPALGATVLDRVHQCMILFAAGRGDALRRFLVDEGVGSDGRFWSLAQVLSYLYPKSSDEKRWVDGLLARKKGLGF
jgi:adenine-specific DNA methylase